MKTKLTATIFFLFFIFPIISYAVSFELPLSDNFDYANAFISNGWLYDNGGCGFSNSSPSLPVNGSFGIMGYNNCAFSFYRAIYQNFSEKIGINFVDTSVMLSYSFYDSNDTSLLSTRNEIKLRKAVILPDDMFIIDNSYLPALAQNENVTKIRNLMGGENCSFRYSRNQWHDVNIFFDFSEHRYYVLMDNSPYCWGIDLGNDEYDYFGGISISEGRDSLEKNVFYFDNLVLNQSASLLGIAPIEEPYHVLFSDNFNYYNSMYAQKGWLVYDNIGSIDTSYTPKENTLMMNEINSEYSPSIKLEPFNIVFEKNGYQYAILQTEYTPIMSIEYDFNTPFNVSDMFNDCFSLITDSVKKIRNFEIVFCPNRIDTGMGEMDNIILLRNGTDYAGLSAGDFNNSIMNHVKLTAFFRNRDYFEFNSSINSNYFNLWVNDRQIYNPEHTDFNIPFDSMITDSSDSIKYIYLKKYIYANVTIDNFKVYLGTDSEYDNTQDYFTTPKLKIFESEKNITIGTGKNTDFATSFTSLYGMMGLKSETSRFMAGVIILFISMLLLSGIMMSYMKSINIVFLMIVAVIEVIFLTYVQLMPIWIIVLFGIFAIGFFIFMVLKAIGSGQ